MVSELQIMDTPFFSSLPDGLWPGLRYSFDSKTAKPKPAGDK